MPSQPRKNSVDPTKIEVHHVWSRCVQRVWLLGEDPLTGVDYSHRRHWLESLLEYLSGMLAVDVGCFHILSNHLHALLRSRPDIAALWSDEEVAWRWLLLWPQYVDDRWLREPTDEQIRDVLAKGDEWIAKLRVNLSSISWLMARWKQPFSLMANIESNKKGHAWEQRFGNRRLEGEDEVLTAFLYNDLQQVRAGVVDSVDDSDFSAIQRQIRAEAQMSLDEFHGMRPIDDAQYELELEQIITLYGNCFLSPISDRSPLITPGDPSPPPSELILPAGYVVNKPNCPVQDSQQPTTAEADAEADAASAPESPAAEARPDNRGTPSRRGRGRNRRRGETTIHERLRRRQRRRASRQSILNMPWEQYRDLLAQVERRCLQQRDESPPPATSPPGAVAPDSTSASWRSEVRSFGRWLRSLAAQLPAELARRLLPNPRGDPPRPDSPVNDN